MKWSGLTPQQVTRRPIRGVGPDLSTGPTPSQQDIAPAHNPLALSTESKVFGKLSRCAPSYPPTVYFVLLCRTRIQQATSLFPGRGGHVPSDLLSAMASYLMNDYASCAGISSFSCRRLRRRGVRGQSPLWKQSAAQPPVAASAAVACDAGFGAEPHWKKLASQEAGVFQA